MKLRLQLYYVRDQGLRHIKERALYYTLTGCDEGPQAGQQLPHINVQVTWIAVDLGIHGGKERGEGEKSRRPKSNKKRHLSDRVSVETAEI